MIYLANLLGLTDGFFYNQYNQLKNSDQTSAMLFFISGILICIVLPYLLGSLNFSIIVSKYMYNDDVRKYGSGNAGLTNMNRVFGKKGALYTLGGDVLKQIFSAFIGLLVFGVGGIYIAGTFCILGHIAPVYYHFKGGKGVLTAATLVLLVDPVIFLCVFTVFALVVLIFKYISLGSMMAGFVYPALVYYKAKTLTGNPPTFPELFFSIFICLLLLFMHRKNIDRILKNEESRFSFKKKPLKEEQKTEDTAEDEDEDVEIVYVTKKPKDDQASTPNLHQKKKK